MIGNKKEKREEFFLNQGEIIEKRNNLIADIIEKKRDLITSVFFLVGTILFLIGSSIAFITRYNSYQRVLTGYLNNPPT